MVIDIWKINLISEAVYEVDKMTGAKNLQAHS